MPRVLILNIDQQLTRLCTQYLLVLLLQKHVWINTYVVYVALTPFEIAGPLRRAHFKNGVQTNGAAAPTTPMSPAPNQSVNGAPIADPSQDQYKAHLEARKLHLSLELGESLLIWF